MTDQPPTAPAQPAEFDPNAWLLKLFGKSAKPDDDNDDAQED